MIVVKPNEGRILKGIGVVCICYNINIIYKEGRFKL